MRPSPILYSSSIWLRCPMYRQLFRLEPGMPILLNRVFFTESASDKCQTLTRSLLACWTFLLGLREERRGIRSVRPRLPSQAMEALESILVPFESRGKARLPKQTLRGSLGLVLSTPPSSSRCLTRRSFTEFSSSTMSSEFILNNLLGRPSIKPFWVGVVLQVGSFVELMVFE